MKIIHSILLSDGNGGTYEATRTSDTRAYGACVVRTVTARSVEIDEAKRAEARVSLVERQAFLAASMARLGMDETTAREAYNALSDRWLAASFALPPAVRRSKDAERTALEGQGLVYPYDADGPMGIIDAAHSVRAAQKRVALAPLAVGSQMVQSWHRDAVLAGRAADGYRSGHEGENGDTFEVRTDITQRAKGRN